MGVLSTTYDVHFSLHVARAKTTTSSSRILGLPRTSHPCPTQAQAQAREGDEQGEEHMPHKPTGGTRKA